MEAIVETDAICIIVIIALGLVAALAFDVGHVLLIHVTRDVAAVKDGGVKGVNGRVVIPDGLDEVLEVLVDDLVRTDLGSNLLVGAIVSDKLFPARHVDAVHIRVSDGRCARSKVHLLGACVAGHLDDFLGGRATHDRVVDEQDVLAVELEGHGIQLPPDILAARLLARHNEGAADVAVLVEAFTVQNLEFV